MAGIAFVVTVSSILLFWAYFYVAQKNPQNGIHQWVTKKIAWGIPLANQLLRLTDIVYLPLMLQPSTLPEYELWIEADEMVELQKLLNEMIETEVLDNDHKIYVNATVRKDGSDYPAEIRFRGDSYMHWKNDKKSWRVKLKRGYSIEGVREFNFILPEDRGYVAEEYSNHLAREMGLDVPESGFVSLKINGVKQGVYFFIEQFGKEFLEKNELSSEANFYGENDDQQFIGGRTNLFNNLSLWQKYTSNEVEEGDAYGDLRLLMDILEARDEPQFKQKIEGILDVENVLHWQAHSVLMASIHQEFSHNVRLYFDRTRGKFRIMPWDVGQTSSEMPIDMHYSPLVTRLLSVPEFRQRRDEILWERVSDPKHLSDDLAYYDAWVDRLKPAFYRDRNKHPFNMSFSLWTKTRRTWIIERYAMVRDQLEYASTSLTAHIGGAFSTIIVKSWGFSGVTPDYARIFTKNEHAEPVVVYWDENQNEVWDDADAEVARLEWNKESKIFEGEVSGVVVTTDRRLPDEFLKPMTLEMSRKRLFLVSPWLSADEVTKVELDLKNSVSGSEIRNENRDLKFINSETFEYFDRTLETAQQTADRYPFLVREESGALTFASGTVEINEVVIIPKESTLNIKAGTTLKMGPGASLVSYGKVFMEGTSTSPIRVVAKDPSKAWGAWALLDHGADGSRISHAEFEGGGEAFINGVFFSGMVAVHFADVEIDHVRFANARGDDGLNIKNARASIKNSLFERNGFDGLDLDFITGGVVENNRFVQNGNDGMDVGGGKVALKDNVVEGSGDKCISIGENASPFVVNNRLSGCNIGIAIKDSSRPKIINVTVSGNKVGIHLYEKKDIFGGGNGMVLNSILWDNEVEIEQDEESDLKIRNSIVRGGYAGEGNRSTRLAAEEELTLGYQP